MNGDFVDAVDDFSHPIWEVVVDRVSEVLYVLDSNQTPSQDDDSADHVVVRRFCWGWVQRA